MFVYKTYLQNESNETTTRFDKLMKNFENTSYIPDFYSSFKFYAEILSACRSIPQHALLSTVQNFKVMLITVHW